MANDVVPIADLMKQLANVKPGVDDDTNAVAGAGGQFKRISIKGGVFRKIVSGKEVAKLTDRSMNVVFVKSAPHPSRMYYVDAYEEGKKTAPVCWSNDSITPAKEVKAPQAATCRECPMSVKGSGRDGKGTACRLSWRTAVVLPNDMGGDVMALTLPAASVWGEEHEGKRPFVTYARFLQSHNVSMGRFVTKMEFDLRKPSPTLLFSAVAAVPEDELHFIDEQRNTKDAELAVQLTVFQGDEGDTEEAAVAAPADPIKAVLEAQAKPTEEQPEKVEEPVPEPVLRESAKVTEVKSEPNSDLSATIKKWAKG